MSWETLTNIVYVFILISFTAAIVGVVLYSRRQSALLKEAQRGGARPHSTAEAIIIAHEQAKKGARR